MATGPLAYGLSQSMVARLSFNPEEAVAPSMPRAAILADHPDACLSIEEIVRRVCVFCCAS
jgi:hypothetical protein